MDNRYRKINLLITARSRAGRFTTVHFNHLIKPQHAISFLFISSCHLPFVHTRPGLIRVLNQNLVYGSWVPLNVLPRGWWRRRALIPWRHPSGPGHKGIHYAGYPSTSLGHLIHGFSMSDERDSETRPLRLLSLGTISICHYVDIYWRIHVDGGGIRGYSEYATVLCDESAY
jgi:hypothetical protein